MAAEGQLAGTGLVANPGGGGVGSGTKAGVAPWTTVRGVDDECWAEGLAPITASSSANTIARVITRPLARRRHHRRLLVMIRGCWSNSSSKSSLFSGDRTCFVTLNILRKETIDFSPKTRECRAANDQVSEWILDLSRIYVEPLYHANPLARKGNGSWRSIADCLIRRFSRMGTLPDLQI